MTDFILLIPVFVSFFIVLFLMPFWIRKSKQVGLVWEDMNKYYPEKVSGSGGIMVVLAFILGLLLFIAYRTFILNSVTLLPEIIVTLSVILLLAGIGLIDDLFGWKLGGLSKRSRLILVAFASVPLMAINAGQGEVSLPFIGIVNFGLIYPIILIPIAMMGTTTIFNFLAGFNGLEAGQGILVILGLSIVAFFTGQSWLAVIGLCMIASLFAFLFYNFFPAKVFPGDVMTYPVGGLITILSILGNFEKIAIFFFIPYILEFILKSRGKLKKYSFGKPLKDGSLDLKYEKIYGLTHLSIFLLKKAGIKPNEKRATYLIWAFQIFVIVVGLIIFGKGIF